MSTLNVPKGTVRKVATPFRTKQGQLRHKVRLGNKVLYLKQTDDMSKNVFIVYRTRKVG